MARKTERFGFQALEGGDDLSEDGYAFTSRDRDVLDQLLAYAVEQHRHTGLSADETVVAAPELLLDTSQGEILSGERAFYRITLVDDSGLETAASPVAHIDTPDAILAPDAPALSTEDTGGTHIPGVYHYVLTAYQDFSTSETTAINRAQIAVPPGTNTNQNTLDLPSLPDGATGFNVYRRAPGATKYFYLDSIDMEVATPPEDYVDDNSVEEDRDRTLPYANTTFSTNTIEVTYPGGVVPDGYTWKIYRTFDDENWDNSTLVWVVEETSEGSGIIDPDYDDTGEGTGTGAPPTGDSAHGSPPKIDLTDAAEVDGTLPPGLNVIPFTVTFAQAGTVPAAPPSVEGEFIWVCEYDFAEILGCRASLGRSSTPDSDDVIVDVNKYDSGAATPSWTTIYTTQANRPTVAVGEFIGERTVPDVTDLVAGDALCIDIDQSGGGAETDADLIVTVYMLVQSESRTTSNDLFTIEL